VLVVGTAHACSALRPYLSQAQVERGTKQFSQTKLSCFICPWKRLTMMITQTRQTLQAMPFALATATVIGLVAVFSSMG
jgi:hypothetical protein